MAPLQLNTRSAAIGESATLSISARAAAMRAAGEDVISLSAGEPDFPTPEPIRREGMEAINRGDTRYTATSGLPPLRQAVSAWFGKEYGLRYDPDQVMVTSGAKAALHMALDVLVDPGDPVLVVAPYWVSYPALVRVAHGVPIVVPAEPEQGFVHTAEQIGAAARESKAKGIILNYPNNPSGAVPTREQLSAIVDAAIDAGLWIIADEIYGKLVYDDRAFTPIAALPQAIERTLVVNGGTKSHSFTGWRIGFLAGPKHAIAAAGRIQSQVLGNPSTIGQYAAIELCRGDYGEEVARRLRSFDQRRHLVHDAVRGMRDLELALPAGAFYALVDSRALCARLGIDDVTLTNRLLEDAKIATVPGSAFGIDNFIRLSFAATAPELERAMTRLTEFVDAD